jgi:hypothetical protein
MNKLVDLMRLGEGLHARGLLSSLRFLIPYRSLAQLLGFLSIHEAKTKQAKRAPSDGRQGRLALIAEKPRWMYTLKLFLG